jgi:hypothetical protein
MANNENNNNDKLVNGPVNAFRLEGEIENKKKVVYLFGDFHHSICAETKCDSYHSKDFVNYFYQTISKTDKTTEYDFLYENYSNVDMFEQAQNTDFKYRDNYINEIRKYIVRDMNLHEKKTKKESKKENKKENDFLYENKGSVNFKNLRLHYLDIRSFYGTDSINSIGRDIFNLIEAYENNGNNWIIDKLVINFYNMKHHLLFIKEHLNMVIFNKSKEKKNIKIDTKEDHIKKEINDYYKNLEFSEKRMEKYSNKIFKKYKNDSVRKKLLKSGLLSDLFKFIDSSVEEINYCIKKLFKIKEQLEIDNFKLNKKLIFGYGYGKDTIKISKLLFKIKIKFDYIVDTSDNVFVHLTDLYLLRRLLDKDFITNGIVYTGMMHTINYLCYLVKDFGFKITNSSYSKINIDDLNKIIIDIERKELDQYVLKPEFNQCSDMSKFPDDFK